LATHRVSRPYLDTLRAEILLQRRDADLAVVEHAGRKCGIDLCVPKHAREVPGFTGSSGSDQWYVAGGTGGSQLPDVIALSDAVHVHAIEDDFSGAALLNLAQPGDRVPAGVAASGRIPGELVHVPAIWRNAAVNANHDALRAEAPGEFVDQRRTLQRRRIDRDLLGATAEYILGIRNTSDAAGDAKRDVEEARDSAHPVSIYAAPCWTCGNVIEHEFVSTIVAIAAGEFEDIAGDAMVTKSQALDDLAIANVEAGNYAAGKNGVSSRCGMRSSISALPLIAAATPADASACRSLASRTPPDACQASVG
jgi:DNA-directed RNA polymerase subunit N (RpoN/RPB10)